jgi:hypothetical protein
MDEFKWIVVGMVAFVAIVFGAFVYSDHLSHIERMECTKARGEWIGKTCIFREPRAQ